MQHNSFIYLITAISVAGVITRPWRLPEFVWAIGGALLLLVTGLISVSTARMGILKGLDVYLFLVGMMLLAESARREGLFDWIAIHATRFAKGSPFVLFTLIFIVGVIVTAFMSNDATIVVLTPAVAAAATTAKIKNPLPLLFICAFIANAASFVLPVSNPANLVIYGGNMPPIPTWLGTYGLPSLSAIVVTFVILWFTQKKNLSSTTATDIEVSPLSKGGSIALGAILVTTIILIIASALKMELGLPSAICGVLTAVTVSISSKKKVSGLLKEVSWSVLLLVAGLFILVEALDQAGAVSALGEALQAQSARSVTAATWVSSSLVAFGCNLINNLPAGLIAGSATATNHLPAVVKASILIGIDIGPNLSVTGSLATILWLTELRRSGITVTFWQFLKLGALVMTPSFVAAVATLLLIS